MKQFISKELISYYESRKKTIERRMEQIISSSVKFDPLFKHTDTYSMLMYGLEGGKKLRGILTVLVCEALNGDVEKAVDAAVAVELIHNASLIHDDVIDGDIKRRGKPSFWKKYGVTAAIISGHYLISLGLSIFRKYGWKAVEVFNKAWTNVVRGGIADIWRGKSLDEKLYRAIAKLKTGEFFAVAAVMGAIAADKYEYIDLAYRYGAELGFSFQIADDIVDVVEATRSPEVVLHSPSLPTFVAWILKESKIKGLKKLSLISPKDLPKIIIEENVISKAIDKLRLNIQKTVFLAKKFPDSKYKNYLIDLPKLSVWKMLSEIGDILSGFNITFSRILNIVT